MATIHHPSYGSLAVRPRKRAKRIYPRVSSKRETKDVRILDFAGYKVGMTELVVIDDKNGSPTHNQQIVVPATVLETPPLKVAGIRAYKSDIWGQKVISDIWAQQDAVLARKIFVAKKKTDSAKKLAALEKEIGQISRITLLVHTQPAKAGIPKKKPEIFEADIGGGIAEKLAFAKERLGKEVSVKDVFSDGEHIDTIGITIGKGHQGSIKRFGLKLPSHKSQKLRRKAATLGPWHPHKVRSTVPQMGQMGFHKRTQYNNRILKIGTDPKEINGSGWQGYGILNSEYIILQGSVQGTTKRMIRMRHAIRKDGKPVAPQVVSVLSR